MASRCSVHISQQLRKLHILLVDTDAQICDKIQQALGNGCSLRFVHSVEEACQFLDAAPPDLLICEVALPCANGLDICRYVRRSPHLRHLPIMVLTTLATLQDKIAGFEAGADDYVVKPFDARHLHARIRLLARIKRLEHEQE